MAEDKCDTVLLNVGLFGIIWRYKPEIHLQNHRYNNLKMTKYFSSLFQGNPGRSMGTSLVRVNINANSVLLLLRGCQLENQRNERQTTILLPHVAEKHE